MKQEQTLNMLINALPGKVTQSNFDEHINEHKPLQDQLYWLTEDMLQVEFPNNFILDVGWYDGKDGRGNFIVYVIHGYDWKYPLQSIKCQTFRSLKRAIRKASAYITTINAADSGMPRNNNSNTFLFLIEAMNGKVIHNEFAHINENISLDNQLLALTEHMLKVEFGELTLEVGWYCTRKPGDTFEQYKRRGHFIASITRCKKTEISFSKDEVLLKEMVCDSFDNLKKAIEKADDFIKEHRH